MQEIIAIVAARGGSKRIPGKNLKEFLGKPLLAWSLEAALNSKYLTRHNLFVSTEDGEIKEFVSKYCNVIDRPLELAADHIWTQPVVDHAISHLKFSDPEAIIVVIQATSPQIDSGTLDKCIERLLDDKLWAVYTVGANMNCNGAVTVLRAKVCDHKGRANYFGVVPTDWIDIDTPEDFARAQDIMRMVVEARKLQ